MGVDIGGTKVSVTLGNSQGKILAKHLLPVLVGKKAQQGIEKVVETLNRLKTDFFKRGLAPFGSRRLLGIGVGVPGPIDPSQGIVERSPHLKGWEGFPLKGFLERKLQLPVKITNDANAAAIGEKVFGGGRRVDNFVYLTISTGIGGGIILGGKLFSGSSFGAGEVGHTIVVPGGARCGCGHQGCLEAYASGTAIADYVRLEIQRGRRLKIPLTHPSPPKGERVKGEGGKITAELVARAAREKDPLALEAFRRAGYFLGIGLANLINLLNPEMLILGGSVMKSSRFLWTSMRESVQCHAWPSLYKGCRIVRTRLGDRVGDLGALALVFARHDLRDI